ncbi:GTPase [Nocardioides panacisoli]|uniref:G domain-containing protein n=1 Tax=Nocardioides panacisoli TaxID=627624 RepID=A0ABP7ITM4_9ACTN
MPGADADVAAQEQTQVRRMATAGTVIGNRISGLESALAAARGRLDPALLDDIETGSTRAADRLRLSARHTVVAIAGATGSGKSSTYNALTGLELSSTGVRRPTTSWATACVFGTEGAQEVLDWLGIPPRHQTMRDSMLDTRQDDRVLDGVVLMDLPDHDSTELSHHLEVDRLVVLADLLVWILDPQKYADAAIHDRYFAPFTTHQDVMLVVLNHIDTVPEDRRQAMVDDVRRLLAADGLPDVKVIPISARAGLGVEDLRAEIVARVDAKRSTTARAEADLANAARRLEEAGGTAPTRELSARRVQQLEASVGEAAGVPAATAGVERNVRARAGRATTWPPLAPFWGSTPPRPSVEGVQRSVVDTEVRSLADEVSEGLTAPWAHAVTGAATARLPELGDQLDASLSGVDLGLDRVPAWVPLLRVVQWVLLLVAVVAGAWWAVTGLDLVELSGDLGSPPDVAGVPLPGFAFAAALLLGLLLALVARLLVTRLAHARSAEAADRLQDVVSKALEPTVVRPVDQELRAYTAFRTGVGAALR